MGKRVDRDLEEIIEFCKSFNSQVLQVIEGHTNTLSGLAARIDSSLEGTKFATKSSEAVSTTAKKLKAAVDQGEQRIREIQKKAEADLDRQKQFER